MKKRTTQGETRTPIDLCLYERAINTYGIGPQKTMLVEEIGELLNVLAKRDRIRATKKEIITELADVHIMVEQIALYYGWAEFKDEKARKLERLNNHLNTSSHE